MLHTVCANVMTVIFLAKIFSQRNIGDDVTCRASTTKNNIHTNNICNCKNFETQAICNFTYNKEVKAMKRDQFIAKDGTKLALYVWDEVQKPKAVIKIAHGMAEHSARYDDFAKYLNKNGFVVVANDHRGHGNSAVDGKLGCHQGDMFEGNVSDQKEIVTWCKKTYKLPTFLFGHSYGSFITQAVMVQGLDVQGYVLCGSNYMKGISYSLCGLIANSLVKRRGADYPAKTIADLSFGMYEKKFEGKNAWLNRKQEEVDKYNEDPWCGFVCSAGFYKSFMKGINQLYTKDAQKSIDVKKPLLIISGAEDPVGENSKGVKKLIKFYEKVGVKKIENHVYGGARHEILNEINKDEVYFDVVAWLNAIV